ncbi:MAG: cbb3-type cytochrome c oxidase subunit I [Planctomycetaceae bacterium]|nr:cbb3-type cytochrome c oxidase subunit I [Planctomycetaceae bacterium]
MATVTQKQQLFGHAPSNHYLDASHGVMSWIFTLDHKRIAIMYMYGVIASLFLAGIFALVLRTELYTTKEWFLTSAQYNQMFTLHGAVMVFLFIIPSVPAIIGNFVLPMMLGAKDVAFPRLNLASLWLYWLGGIFFIVVLATTQLDTGWTFYTPYSTSKSNTNVIAATMGAFILGFSSIFTGLNFIVTINTMRPKGMTWFRMPLLLWGLYSTSIIQVLATPVLGITLLLLIVERTLKLGIFDPNYGGDPLLYQHFFWFYSHPAVYIMILPAMGVVSEMLAVHCRKEVFGYKFIAMSSVAIALIGFLVWGHHLFTSGQSDLTSLVFSAITFSVAVPSAVKVFNWLCTMYRGDINLSTPMLYVMSFIFLFGIGGLTGLWLGALSTDIPLHDTYFVVAHFHYVMVGGTMTALLGGLFHWWPKFSGRMYNEPLGKLFCFFVFVGFNLTFFPQFIMGSLGMPRRYHEYAEIYQIYHQASTWGAYTLGIGIFGAVMVLVYAWFFGRKASGNPWGAATLEWQCSSPPSFHNFEHRVIVSEPYDFASVVYDESVDGYVPVIPKRETTPNQQPATVPH